MTDCSLLVAREAEPDVHRQPLRRDGQRENIPEPAAAAAATEEARVNVHAEQARDNRDGSLSPRQRESAQPPPNDVSDSSTSNEETTSDSSNGGHDLLDDAEATDTSSNRVVSPDAEYEPDGVTKKITGEQCEVEAPSAKQIKVAADVDTAQNVEVAAAEVSHLQKQDSHQGMQPQQQYQRRRQQQQRQPRSEREILFVDPSKATVSGDPNSKSNGISILPHQQQQTQPSCQPKSAKPSSGSIKSPPAYSLTPQLLAKAKSQLNQSLQPDQKPSHRFLERFHKRQEDRRRQRLAAKKKCRQKRKEEQQKRNFVPLSPTRFQSMGRFHYNRESFAQLGLNYLRRCQPTWQEEHFLPAIQMLANGSKALSNNPQFQLELMSRLGTSATNQRGNIPLQGPPTLPTSYRTPPSTPPSIRQETSKSYESHQQLPLRQDVNPRTGRSSCNYGLPNESDEDIHVSIDEITNRGQGQEWTCVFSIVGEWEVDFDPVVSLQKNLNRLVGYRMQFDGVDQGLNPNEAGERGRILPPEDEQTRLATATSGMEGTLERRTSVVSCHPDSGYELVLRFGWRPIEGSPAELYGLDDYWSYWMANLEESERKAHFVEVTVEGCTAKDYHLWSESFPFGDLFGEGVKGSDRVALDDLKERYWKCGIIVLFHWEYDGSGDQTENGHKEFALFVPSSHVYEGDAAIHTSIVQLTGEDDASSKSSVEF